MANHTFHMIDEFGTTRFDKRKYVTVFDALKIQRFARGWLAKRKLRRMKFDAWYERLAQQRESFRDGAEKPGWFDEFRANKAQIIANLSESMNRDKARADYRRYVLIVSPKGKYVEQTKKDAEAKAERARMKVLEDEAQKEELALGKERISASEALDLKHAFVQQQELQIQQQEQNQELLFVVEQNLEFQKKQQDQTQQFMVLQAQTQQVQLKMDQQNQAIMQVMKMTSS